MVGTLKARVGGQWVPILGSGQDAANTARWNTSWGIIAVGSMKGQAPTLLNPNTYTPICNDLTVTLVSGRRYRVAFAVRAIQTQTNSPSQMNYRLRDNGAVYQERLTFYGGVYLHAGDDWIVNGDDASHTFNIDFMCGIAAGVYTDNNYHFYVEDVGPMSMATIARPVTSVQPWTPLTLQSGWTAISGEVPSYRKIGDIVYLRGSATINGLYAMGYPLTTLPVGFRPGLDYLRLNLTTLKAGIGGAYLIRAHLAQSNGSLHLSEYSNADQYNPQTSLDNISFSITP